jgi:hypothetical protein
MAVNVVDLIGRQYVYADYQNTSKSIQWLNENMGQRNACSVRTASPLSCQRENTEDMLAGSTSVNFSRNTHGLSFKEREFKPQSLKHVQSDNTYTSQDFYFDETKMDLAAPSSENMKATPSGHHSNFWNMSNNVSFQPASTRLNSDKQIVFSTALGDELFNLLTSNIKNIVFRYFFHVPIH